MKKILKVDQIQKYYGNKDNITKAIDGISFDVEEGEFIGIMGASGSGKTTLLNCISTIDNVSAGHIYLEEQDITEIKEEDIAKFRRKNLGFIFQDFNLLDTLTIEENIALILTIDSKAARQLLEIMEDMNKSMNATILMVTHDPLSASYCSKILFLKDGKIFNKIEKGDNERKAFYNEILDVLALLGGDARDVR